MQCKGAGIVLRGHIFLYTLVSVKPKRNKRHYTSSFAGFLLRSSPYEPDPVTCG